MNAANRFNAEYTLNRRMQTYLEGKQWSHPSWLPAAPSLVMNLNEWAINPPCISLVHIPVSTEPIGQMWVGDAAGFQSVNLLELSVWVSRGSPSYMAEMRYLCSLVEDCWCALSSLPIEDSLSIGEPMPTEYKIDIVRLQWAGAIEDDPNPDILRMRGLLRYQFIGRSNGD